MPACCALGPGSLLVSSLRFSENPPDSASTPFLRRSDPIGRCTPGFSFKCRCGSQLQPPQSLSQPQASPCCCRLRSTPGPPSPALGLRECGASCCVLGRAGFEGAGPLRTDGRTLPPPLHRASRGRLPGLTSLARPASSASSLRAQLHDHRSPSASGVRCPEAPPCSTARCLPPPEGHLGRAGQQREGCRHEAGDRQRGASFPV